MRFATALVMPRVAPRPPHRRAEWRSGSSPARRHLGSSGDRSPSAAPSGRDPCRGLRRARRPGRPSPHRPLPSAATPCAHPVSGPAARSWCSSAVTISKASSSASPSAPDGVEATFVVSPRVTPRCDVECHRHTALACPARHGHPFRPVRPSGPVGGSPYSPQHRTLPHPAPLRRRRPPAPHPGGVARSATRRTVGNASADVPANGREHRPGAPALASGQTRGMATRDAALLLRRGHPSDAAALARVQARAAVVAYAHIFPPAAPKPTTAALTPSWTDVLIDPMATVIVAEGTVMVDVDDGAGVVDGGDGGDDGRAGGVVGGVVVRAEPAAPCGFLLERLYVDPSHWGSGVGGLLHDAAVRAARQRGACGVNLWVLLENHRARAMYERRGWHLVAGEQLAHTSPPITEVRYELELPDEERPDDASYRTRNCRTSSYWKTRKDRPGRAGPSCRGRQCLGGHAQPRQHSA